MNERANLTTLALTLLLVVGIPLTAFGQRDKSDRPGPTESRAVRSKEIVDEGKKTVKETPQEFIERELRKNSAALEVSRLRAARPSFRTLTLGSPTPEDQLVQAVENSRRDYKNIFKKNFDSTPDYGESHALLRLDDFARAYVIALDPAVAAKFGNGFSLAEKRSQVTSFGSYEEILQRDVPSLSNHAIKALVSDAKKAVGALLERKPGG